MTTRPLNLSSDDLVNGLTIEASAGTGKTYSVAALVTREIATKDDLRIENILITTFTRAAAAELRDRIRRRLSDTAEKLAKGESDQRDKLLSFLEQESDAEKQRFVRNLRRAVVNFDNATIGTIHSVCSRVLAMAGIEVGGVDAEDLTGQFVMQAVNDRLVAEAATNGRVWDEAKINELVATCLNHPLAELIYGSDDPETQGDLASLKVMIEELVEEIHERTKQHPSYNDLVRRAEAILSGAGGDAVRKRFAERFSLALIDEAQDTDELQWRLFHHIFPKGDAYSTHRLIAVGDPKQAIYSFRGADVYAYLAARDPNLVSTLTVNYRSDQPVIDALNMLFKDRSLGEGIDYVEVSADTKNQTSRVAGIGCVEVIDIGGIDNAEGAADAASRQVWRLLRDGMIHVDGAPEGIRPEHICVLARSNRIVRLIQNTLQKANIPAVASGAGSVFEDVMATDLRLLLVALERVSDTGRIRNVATTSFFGVSLGDKRLLPADLIQKPSGAEQRKENDLVLAIQRKLGVWHQVLRKRGVSALLAEIESDPDVMSRFVSGVSGERRLADLSHIFDLLHSETKGKACSPTRVIEAFDSLAQLDGNSDVVTRRVESDLKAVQVMTVHKAKGLEFPCVVVADLWKPKKGAKDIPIFRVEIEQGRSAERIDIGWVIGKALDPSKASFKEFQSEELKRLMYVAFTRAEHHLSFTWASQNSAVIIPEVLNTDVIGARLEDGTQRVARLAGSQLDGLGRYSPKSIASPSKLQTAIGPNAVEQTLRRTSFTAITRAQKTLEGRVGEADFERAGSGNDEENPFAGKVGRYASAETPTGIEMPLARVAGGKHVGKVLHAIYERIDTSSSDLSAEVAAKCQEAITGGRLRDHLEEIISGIELSLLTPLGTKFGGRSLADIGSANRLPELNFEMAVAGLASGVKVSDFGRVLADLLDPTDVLHPYAEILSHDSFGIELAGLINGSIDAVLQLGTDEHPEIWITDYKSNRLDQDGAAQLIDAYRQDRLWEAMVDHHYPLQALIYGAAMYRYLRWRMGGEVDHSDFIKGFSYFFIRGMVGVDTPQDDGKPNGVFTWTAPAGLWRRLSDRLAGDPW